MSTTAKRPWLEYVLEKLEFQNGAILGFKNARMLYRDDRREIVITRLGSPPLAVDAKVRAVMAKRSPVKEISYEMRVDGYPPQAFFFHPMPAGAEVFLEPRPNGQNVLYVNQRRGETIFSKDWTLRQVTEGNIPIDRPVWQFHGYKHEH